MDKADTDDSTLPDTGGKTGPDPATPRTVPAVTKAPAPVRSIGGHYEPPRAPPACEDRGPPGFPGFVFLRDVLNRFSYYAFLYDIPTKCWPDKAEHRLIDQVIENYLATGAGRAAGIHPRTGVAVWAPRETWRLSRSYRGRQEYATWRALKGEPVRFPFQSRSFECEPFLSCREMLLALGAETPPTDPPQWVLDSIQDIIPPAPRQAGPIYRTGLPGRDSSWHLCEPEFLRRRDAGMTEANCAVEARELEAWLRENHPGAPRMTARTIRNRLLKDHGNVWRSKSAPEIK